MDDDVTEVNAALHTVYSETKALQKGSRLSLAPLPSLLEYEENTDQDGQRWLTYVFHTPIAAFRLTYPEEAVREQHAALGKLLDVTPTPKLHIASEMPEGEL
jgi:hypothetical protein